MVVSINGTSTSTHLKDRYHNDNRHRGEHNRREKPGTYSYSLSEDLIAGGRPAKREAY